MISVLLPTTPNWSAGSQLRHHPGFGGSQRLARLIGTGEAKEMIYTGSMIDAEEALRIGLINRITTQENLIPECEAILRKIMSKAPMAIASAKNAINTGMNMDLRSGLAYEAQVFGSCLLRATKKKAWQPSSKRENLSLPTGNKHRASDDLKDREAWCFMVFLYERATRFA